jgi:hypothetical protein
LEKLVKAISENKISIIHLVDELKTYQITEKLRCHPNFDIVTYEKGINKEYFLEDKVDFSAKYSFINDIELTNFGVLVDGELYQELDESAYLNYEISRTNLRARTVELQGTLKGSGADFDHPVIGEFEIHAISNADYLSLPLYKDLLLEGYLLEAENNIKMAFFTYFSSIEALLRESLEDVKATLYTELHEALEHLQLDSKVRIVAKDVFNTQDLASIKLWGGFMGALKDVKTLRNQIAHGIFEGMIQVTELQKCKACLIVLHIIIQSKLTTMEQIMKKME